ncbi:hypothetical protein M2390_000861 [Mycetocola sp. BIGb0189]|uniref:Abi family protein n=1 Tax=Mycetocola sp. BIGb0189 TaxID=2940604 RepID=UPI002168E9F9|nr:Abi family protein [Mycetocola sp. BIGb0189]MCS4275700.1 hypothetical protein [Mycetocola sp. BIGb0189]
MEELLGRPRFAVYLRAMNNDPTEAVRLYRWNAEVAAEFHKHTAHFEVILRNAIDRGLSRWNQEQVAAGHLLGPDWTEQRGAGNALYRAIGRKIADARNSADQISRNRPIGHPRRGTTPNHDDVLSTLMFGTWTQLIVGLERFPAPQIHLWSEALSLVFAGTRLNGDDARVDIGRKLNLIRLERNRAAHHESFLGVKPLHRLNDMLAVLAAINPRYPDWFMQRSNLRNLVEQDPRRE